MSVVSKSMFSGTTMVNYQRPLYNPVFNGYLAAAGGGGGGVGELALITADNLDCLKVIETLYGSRMAAKVYEQIPNDYNQYIQLYVKVRKIQDKIKEPKLLILLKLAEEALVGAINSYAIYGSNVALTLDKVGLNKTIDDILSNKNEKLIEMANATGQLTITKTFKLAPVFNYYIVIYGMPAYGVGFEPAKINFLVDVLQKNGINPYK